jgi:hypothetical protein
LPSRPCLTRKRRVVTFSFLFAQVVVKLKPCARPVAIQVE